MNTFAKIILALVAAAATLLAITVLIGSLSEAAERKRRSSDIKSKLRIAGMKKDRQLSRIADEVADSIADFRDTDDDGELEVVVMKMPDLPDTSDMQDDFFNMGFDLDAVEELCEEAGAVSSELAEAIETDENVLEFEKIISENIIEEK